MSLDVTLTNDNGEEIYSANITHNLGKMAAEAGIYKHLWRPESLGITKASQLIEPLTEGLMKMVTQPTHYKTFDSPNGWGMYKHFTPWISEYLEACINNPEANVEASR